MSSEHFLPTVLTACLSLVPLQNCMGQVTNANPRGGIRAQASDRLTPLDLSKISLNEDISFLSAPEQARYQKWRSEFFESLKLLPEQDQRELKEVYKWIPDVVKIIASRDTQDRKNDASQVCSGSKFYPQIERVLFPEFKQKSKISNPGGEWYLFNICREMVQYQYPLKVIHAKKQGNVQVAPPLTPLNLSRITFNDNISFLSAPEQALYRKCQAEFFQSLKHLPLKDQQEMRQVYKWVPDIVKIIASRDYQDRARKEYELRPGTEIYENTKRALYKNLYKKQKTEIPNPRGMWYVVDICNEMIQYRYPLKTFDTKNQSIDDNAKKCGFGYLSKMIDFCNNPDNVGKKYKDCADSRTYDLMLEEMRVFEKIGARHENVIWQDFKMHPFFCNRIWMFDLAKVDTSNLTPAEYKKMERQLKCVPPEILISSRYRTSYDGRLGMRNGEKIIEDPSYIPKYAKWKGFSLSEAEVKEVYELASELLKYGTPLKLVKRDDTADLEKVAKDYGFLGVWACSSWIREIKPRVKYKFYEGHSEEIPEFVKEAKDFYHLAMAINPDGAKGLYRNITTYTGLTIQPAEPAPDTEAAGGIGSSMSGGLEQTPEESNPAQEVATAPARKATPATPHAGRTKPPPVADDVRVRVAALAEQRVREKLAAKQYTPIDLARHEVKGGVLWIQRFTADGRTLRTGVLERNGELTPLSPTELSELMPR